MHRSNYFLVNESTGSFIANRSKAFMYNFCCSFNNTPHSSPMKTPGQDAPSHCKTYSDVWKSEVSAEEGTTHYRCEGFLTTIWVSWMDAHSELLHFDKTVCLGSLRSLRSPVIEETKTDPSRAGTSAWIVDYSRPISFTNSIKVVSFFNSKHWHGFWTFSNFFFVKNSAIFTEFITRPKKSTSWVGFKTVFF